MSSAEKGGDHEPLLRCEQLVVGHRRRALLPPFDLDLCRGQLTFVVGRNGAGKSTWLKTVVGLLKPVSGAVRLPPPPPRISYSPQAAQIDRIVPLRGRDIVDWGRIRGWQFLRPFERKADRRARADAIRLAGAEEFECSTFSELSGGQKERLLFARILASEPEIALLDEPTAAMDIRSEKSAYIELARHAHERRMAIVVITHTLKLATEFADQIVFFDRADRAKDGHVEIGSPAEVMAHPRFHERFGHWSGHV